MVSGLLKIINSTGVVSGNSSLIRDDLVFIAIDCGAMGRVAFLVRLILKSQHPA